MFNTQQALGHLYQNLLFCFDVILSFLTIPAYAIILPAIKYLGQKYPKYNDFYDVSFKVAQIIMIPLSLLYVTPFLFSLVPHFILVMAISAVVLPAIILGGFLDKPPYMIENKLGVYLKHAAPSIMIAVLSASAVSFILNLSGIASTVLPTLLASSLTSMLSIASLVIILAKRHETISESYLEEIRLTRPIEDKTMIFPKYLLKNTVDYIKVHLNDLKPLERSAQFEKIIEQIEKIKNDARFKEKYETYKKFLKEFEPKKLQQFEEHLQYRVLQSILKSKLPLYPKLFERVELSYFTLVDPSKKVRINKEFDAYLRKMQLFETTRLVVDEVDTAILELVETTSYGKLFGMLLANNVTVENGASKHSLEVKQMLDKFIVHRAPLSAEEIVLKAEVIIKIKSQPELFETLNPNFSGGSLFATIFNFYYRRLDAPHHHARAVRFMHELFVERFLKNAIQPSDKTVLKKVKEHVSFISKWSRIEKSIYEGKNELLQNIENDESIPPHLRKSFAEKFSLHFSWDNSEFLVSETVVLLWEALKDPHLKLETVTWCHRLMESGSKWFEPATQIQFKEVIKEISKEVAAQRLRSTFSKLQSKNWLKAQANLAVTLNAPDTTLKNDQNYGFHWLFRATQIQTVEFLGQQLIDKPLVLKM